MCPLWTLNDLASGTLSLTTPLQRADADGAVCSTLPEWEAPWGGVFQPGPPQEPRSQRTEGCRSRWVSGDILWLPPTGVWTGRWR